jgi:hypothetical protein
VEQTSNFYTPEQAAQALNKSRAWVYRHASALGAFQSHLGCALSIPVKVIEAINEGRYALPNEGRTLARTPDDRRERCTKICDTKAQAKVWEGQQTKES